LKVLSTVLKIVAALAVIAGVVYVVAAYGDKIVAWSKNLLGKCRRFCVKSDFCCGEVAVEEVKEDVEEAVEEAAEEADFQN